MLTVEENRYLTEVGPGTPMGNLLRRFWVPCLMSREVEANVSPVSLRLLGQDLVAFRDAQGRVGVLDEHCAHRGASLVLGRCEADGLRCVYHGWKYAADGQILETPNVRDERLKQRLHAAAYPVEELGDVIWVYLGPQGTQPPVPRFPFTQVPPEQRDMDRIQIDVNWVQIMESGIDESHAGILHQSTAPFGKATGKQRDQLQSDGGAINRPDGKFTSEDNAPRLEVEDTPWGSRAVAIREAVTAEGEPAQYVRVGGQVIPWTALITPGTTVFYVPRDDHSTSLLSSTYNPTGPVKQGTIHNLLQSERYFDGIRFAGNKQNRWLQDRSVMDDHWSGVEVFSVEDWAVTASMGPVFDRSREHVVAADAHIVRMRRQLLKAARELESGTVPGVVGADVSDARTPAGLLPVDAPWQKVFEDTAGGMTSDR